MLRTKAIIIVSISCKRVKTFHTQLVKIFHTQLEHIFSFSFAITDHRPGELDELLIYYEASCPLVTWPFYRPLLPYLQGSGSEIVHEGQ